MNVQKPQYIYIHVFVYNDHTDWIYEKISLMSYKSMFIFNKTQINSLIFLICKNSLVISQYLDTIYISKYRYYDFCSCHKIGKWGRYGFFFYLVSIIFRFEKFLLLTVSVFSVYWIYCDIAVMAKIN